MMETNEIPAAVAVVTDLVFSSRILSTGRALGVTVRCVRSATQLAQALAAGGVRLAIIDMELPGEEALDALQTATAHKPAPAVLAFYPHVRADLKQSAKAAGADYVLPRSQFDEQFLRLLKAHCIPAD